MSIEFIIAIVGYVITLVSTLSVVKTEIANLKKQVEKHNSVIERTYKLEEDYRLLHNQVQNNEIAFRKHIQNKH